VLIIDDEEVYRVHLAKILNDEGHTTRTASDGPRAIDIATTFRPHVLIADWLLADDCSGFDVARTLQNTDPDMRTIIITGFDSKDLQDKGRTEIFQYLDKPFEMHELVNAVRSAFDDRPAP
jgi:DNA-binding NtrC family response regulator